MKEQATRKSVAKDDRLSLLFAAAADPSSPESSLVDLLSGLTPADVDFQSLGSPAVRGATVLHVASGSGHVGLVRLLLDRGANVTLADHRGRTALHWAARRNRAECAALLVAAFPGLVNWQDYGGRSPLHAVAAAPSSRRLAEALLGVAVVSATPLDNRFATPLHVAACAGTREVAELLLRRGVAPAEWRDERGATPLHYAAVRGHWELFQCLSAACEPRHDHTDNAGLSPLLWACLGSDSDAFVRPYCRQTPGAVVGERAPNGASAVHLAAMSGHAAQLAALLDANPDAARVEDVLRLTPLHYAAAAGRLEAARALLAAADASPDLHGRSPLHWAARGGHAALCRLLLRPDDAQAADALGGHFPLHLACVSGSVAAVAALLGGPGCWTAMADADGCSPLHLAAFHGHLDVCKLLLDRLEPRRQALGANLCRPGLTALDVALHRGATLVCELIIARGGLSVHARRRQAATVIQRAFRRRRR